MKNKNKFLIVGTLLFLLVFTSITELNSSGNVKSESPNLLNLNKFNELNSTYADNTNLKASDTTENNTGCTSVIVHVKHGNDVLSYRRDSGYAANIIIEKINFNGQNAIKEYKVQNGYFSHTILTENGWIINIGGKDDPTMNKQLETLGRTIISKGKIEKKDIKTANTIIKGNGWGHFVIKSPDDNVGITSCDYRVSLSMTKLFKMKDGDYIKVPNNPRYYRYGKFNKFSNDPANAAIKIIGNDIFGQNRRDVITYSYNNSNSKIVDIWASFDGGTLLNSAKGSPDNIQFFGKKIYANELPKIPDKKFLGGVTLQK